MKIYGLADPRTQELKYVGFTTKTLRERLVKGHLSSTSLKKKNYKNSWIKSLLNGGLSPEIFLLQKTDKNNWSFDEQWNIEYFKSIGCRLTNLSRGGRGSLGFKHSEKAKKKIRKASKGNKHCLGKKLSQQQCIKISERNKRMGIQPVSTPEIRERNSKIVGDKLRGVPRPDWVKEKIKKSHIGLKHSVETKNKLSNINKKFTQKQIDEIFKEYSDKEKLSMSKLAKKHNVVTSVMFNILHEIKYKCSDSKLRQIVKNKLEKRSVNSKVVT